MEEDPFQAWQDAEAEVMGEEGGAGSSSSAYYGPLTTRSTWCEGKNGGRPRKRRRGGWRVLEDAEGWGKHFAAQPRDKWTEGQFQTLGP